MEACFAYQRHEQQTEAAGVHAANPVVDYVHADIRVSSGRRNLWFIVDAAAAAVHAAGVSSSESDERGGLTLLNKRYGRKKPGRAGRGTAGQRRLARRTRPGHATY